jgi:hypothetical protein
LAPSKEWGNADDTFFVGMVGIDGGGVFDNISVTKIPLTDINDTQTGFKAVKRDFTWSGYDGKAIVVSFDTLFPFSGQDKKFVFWDQANFVPVWYMNESMLYSYEFTETWGGGSVGCHEPMSDRNLRYSKVEIIEDNIVRKVIHWSYVLIDPDYKTPDDGKGVQLPEVDEYYTLYADGSIIRKIKYTPKLDTDFRKWHELTELIVIAGNNQRPKDFMENPALSVYEIGSSVQNFYPLGQYKYSNNYKLGATALIAHFKNEPDAFNVFSDESRFSETFANYQLDYKIEWHNLDLNFGHWPINKEPYAEPFVSWSLWKEQISHSSLAGMGVYGGADWNDNYKIDTNGRNYREWVSLLGLNESKNLDAAQAKSNSWLFKGDVTVKGDASVFVKYNVSEKLFEFESVKDIPECSFQIKTDEVVINPVIKIRNWNSQNVNLKVNNTGLINTQFRYFISNDNSLMLMIPGTFTTLDATVSTQPVSVSNLRSDTAHRDLIICSRNSEIQVYFKKATTASISLKDINGKELFHTQIKSDEIFIDTTGYTSGVYLLTVYTGADIYTRKIVIQNS